MTLWHENLKRLVAAVEDKLSAADAVVGPLVRGGDYHEWKGRALAAEAELVRHFSGQEEARFGESGGAYSVRMAGISSSSTISISSALRNWRTAAQLKLAQEPSDAHRLPSPYSTEAGMNGGLGRDEVGDPINLQGSGPAPIQPRSAP